MQPHVGPPGSVSLPGRWRSWTGLNRTWAVDLTSLRRLGMAMIGLGLTLPLLPHNPGLPCPLRTLTGVPCPACGMTTSVKAAMSGRLHASVAANPFGIVALVVAGLLVLRPRWRRAQVPPAAIVIAGLASWIWELGRFHFL